MFLKKIKFFDANTDEFKTSINKNLIRKNGKFVQNKEEDRIVFKYHSPTYRPDGGNYFRKNQIIETNKTDQTENMNIGSSLRSYHYGNLVIPESRNLIAVNDDSKATSSGRITAKFNFVSEQYESFISNINERTIPCIYLESDPAQTETLFETKFLPRIIPKARHFYDFNYILKPRYKTPDSNRFKNLLFGQNFSMAPANAEREQYPFYNRIKFNYQTTNSFKNTLKEYNFFEQFIEDYMSKPTTETGTFFTETTENQQSSIERRTFITYDVLDWIQRSDLVMNNDDKVIFEPSLKRKSRYRYYLDKVAFVGKLRKFCKDKMPNVEDILNNKPVETETLFYKIDKQVDGSPRIIQSFWIPADDGFVDLIDTQIKYGVKYRYTVSAYVLAYGCNYKSTSAPPVGNKVRVNFEMTPSFKLIEIPNIYTDICRVIQPPQPVPTVRFVNEKNADDYLRIYLNLTLNSNNQPLEVINAIESEQEILRKEYDRLEERDRFVYNNERALYEIYRTDFQPKSFLQLANYKLTEIRNAFPSTGASHKDYVIPFKKYYYVFRSVNFHGLVSNPTPIYEVELTKDADETFLSAKAVGFLNEETSQTTRRFMRLMQAVPASQHTIFEGDVNGMLDEDGNQLDTLRGVALSKLSLGIAKRPIWGKKFKFRITSTTTGKKLDVNIMVNLIKKKTMENSK